MPFKKQIDLVDISTDGNELIVVTNERQIE